MAPFILKFKGNKSFVAFHNMNDGDSLTKTWKVCTKVAAHLEQGQRLENLSWRLWHLHNIMVETDNAKSKREFKKLSRTMGDKLDREKGKNIEELRAPGYKRTESSDKMRRRAEEIERLRDESQSGGGMKRMQFTFSLDTPSSSQANSPKAKITVSTHPGKKAPVFKEPALKVDATKGGGSKQKTTNDKSRNDKITSFQSNRTEPENSLEPVLSEAPTAILPSCTSPSTIESTSPASNASTASSHPQQSSVRLPGIFSSNFGPTALLYPSPSLAPSLTYGEDVSMSHASINISPNGGMDISRPTIELPLDELLEVDGDTPDAWGEVLASIDASKTSEDQSKDQTGRLSIEDNPFGRQEEDHKPIDLDFEMVQMMQAEVARISTATSHSSTQQNAYQSGACFYPKQSPSLARQRQAPATTLNPMALHQSSTATVKNGNANGNANAGNGRGTPSATAAPTSTPAGTKTECSNCGATHTPLWRRGLNDELNCNACGLYCKLHKRPRPKSMRAPHGDSARNSNANARSIDNDTIGAKCFNCHTTATPLWRKDDEGKTVCNACGLYYKLHGTNRPLSMKSDVIRKRSRHEIRRAGLPGSSSETPSASPGASRRASPARATTPPPASEEHQDEQKTPQFSYDYTSKPTQTDYARKGSPANDMLSSVSSQDQNDSNSGPNVPYSGYFPGPYHPDYLYQYLSSGSDLYPIQTANTDTNSGYGMEDRGNKRRRLSSASHDSASTPTDPPPSASSLNSGHTKSPISSPTFPSYGLPYSVYSYQGFSDTSQPWMSGRRIHPPMALPEDAPMEYLHPPMALPESTSQSSSYLHPPMLPVEEVALNYMHPPMVPQANSPIVGYTHPPMLPSYWNNDQNITYSDNSNNSNENSNSNMEMFDSMMNPIE